MMRQVENIRDIFAEFFTHYVPDRIIELGTGHGEFCNIVYELREAINPDFDMITFDVGDGFQKMNKHLMTVRCDIFSNMSFIKELIKENTLILCDNGNKVKEVRELIPVLKDNCVIMAHDFGGQECWGWEEIRLSDVQDLIEQYSLSPFHQELMLHGAWMSLINKFDN